MTMLQQREVVLGEDFTFQQAFSMVSSFNEKLEDFYYISKNLGDRFYTVIKVVKV